MKKQKKPKDYTLWLIAALIALAALESYFI
jgi:hypothetical protein